jgi:hypothetical protein
LVLIRVFPRFALDRIYIFARRAVPPRCACFAASGVITVLVLSRATLFAALAISLFILTLIALNTFISVTVGVPVSLGVLSSWAFLAHRVWIVRGSVHQAFVVVNSEADIRVISFVIERETIAVVVRSFPILGDAGTFRHFLGRTDIWVVGRIGTVASASVLPGGTTECIPLEVVVGGVFRLVHNLMPRYAILARVIACFATSRISIAVTSSTPIVSSATTRVTFAI